MASDTKSATSTTPADSTTTSATAVTGSTAVATGATAATAADRADADRKGWSRSSGSAVTVPPKVRELFARRPTVGPGPAAQAVATDLSQLVSAEVDLAKAKLTTAATAKGLGVGLLVGAGVLGWLAFQGLLITAAIALAIVLPLWLAALIVCLVLLLIAGILALIGRKKLQTPLPTDEIKNDLNTDVELVKQRVSGGKQ